MIYISTAYLNNNNLTECLELLAENGFNNIELSGNINYYDGIEEDLINLKAQHNLNYLCHSYFPAPKEPFVLNLASLDDEIYERTLSHLQNLVVLCERLGSDRMGFHAGHFINIAVEEIGNNLNPQKLFEKGKSLERFCEGFERLRNTAGAVELYIENNVISDANLKTFNNVNPLMLTGFNDFVELKERIDFKLLLDIGHLKVSAASLGLDFKDELSKMISVSDYLHCSDNDGLSDGNEPLLAESSLFGELKNYSLDGKTITLEVAGTMEATKNSYNLLAGILNDRKISL
ncbi:MAG: sugar phosphate isomerase/epimerase [Sedimentisphaerales bacterium]|nr:sugar phosphate isomerase/epimerase [Sedimentisphaerales bacterium]